MIGVIGAYGAVGLEVARLLAGQGVRSLRLGGRDLQANAPRLRRVAPDAELVAVDLEQPASLASFVRGCSLVVDCAGPSSRLASRVARAAQEAGAHLVSAGSDSQLEAWAGSTAPNAVIFSAGALPGVSGLLPRWLAGSFDRVRHLSVYAGVFDHFTAAGAEDYLAGALRSSTEPLAAWQHGGPRPGAFSRRTQVRLPFFPRDLTLFPYLDSEGRELARALALDTGRWYLALDGAHLPAALDAARTTERAAATEALSRASALDVAGRKPYVRLLVQLDGLADGVEITRTALLSAPGIAPLTAAVTAAVTLTLLREAVPSGVRAAAALPAPAFTIELLRMLPGACELTVFDLSVDALTEVVGGAL